MQVDCLSEVLCNNFIPRRSHDTDKGALQTASPRDKGTPSKFLLVGRSVSLSLLTTAPLDDDAPPVSPRLATPLVLATVYNPVCVIELSTSATKMEASCFNMAISYSLEHTSVCKSHLLLLTFHENGSL